VKRMTRDELTKRHWWWRFNNNLWVYNPKTHTTKTDGNCGNLVTEDGRIYYQVKFVCNGKLHPEGLFSHCMWKAGMEWSAYAYELVRRADRKTNLTSYFDLTTEEHLHLLDHFGKSQRLSHYSIVWPPLKEMPGYTDGNIHWNLGCTNGQLRAGFLRWIDEQRAEKHIPAPRGRTGQTTKSPSWLWPEILDLDANRLRADKDFDSGLLSRAKKRAGDLAIKFWQSLNQSGDRKLRWSKKDN